MIRARDMALIALTVANVAVLRHVTRRSQPTVLRGAKAIARRLRMTPQHVHSLHAERQLPTFRRPGDDAMHATAAALDDWRRLWAGTPTHD